MSLKNNRKILLGSFLFFEVFFLFSLPQAKAATTYYVDTNGSNSNSGTLAAPFASLSYACSKALSNGDIIHINAGITYADSGRCNLAIGVSIQGAGVATTQITSSYNGSIGTGYIYSQTNTQSPLVHGNNEISGFTLDGNGKTLYTGIFIRGTDNLNIHDLKFQNILSNAIWIQGAYDWTNSDMTPPPAYGKGDVIHDIQTDDTTTVVNLGAGPTMGAIMLLALQDAQVYNLTINENKPGRGTGLKSIAGWLKGFKGYNWNIRTDVTNSNAFVFEMYNFSGDSEIYNSVFYQSISLNGGPQILDPNSTWNLKIHDTVTDFRGISGALGHELSHNYLDFYNNYIFGNHSGRAAGLWTTNDSTLNSVNNWRFRNNVLYDCAASGVDIEKDGTLSNIEIYNNVIDTIASTNSIYDGYGIEGVYFTGNIAGSKIENNLIMHSDSGPITISSAFSNTKIDHNWFYGNGNNNNEKDGGSSTNLSSNTKGVLPGITSSGARPMPFYYPTSSSNLINVGTDVGLPFSGNSPDIGAYEYSNVNVAPAAPTQLSVM